MTTKVKVKVNNSIDIIPDLIIYTRLVWVGSIHLEGVRKEFQVHSPLVLDPDIDNHNDWECVGVFSDRSAAEFFALAIMDGTIPLPKGNPQWIC